VRSTLYSAFGIRKLATVYTPSNDYAVLIETDRAQQLDPAVLSKVYVRSATGPRFPQQPTTATAWTSDQIETQTRVVAAGHRDRNIHRRSQRWRGTIAQPRCT